MPIRLTRTVRNGVALRVDFLLEDRIYAGQDLVHRFLVTQPDGQAEDVSGWAIEWALRQRAEDSSALVSKSVGSGITIVDGPNGVVDVAIADTDTLTLSGGKYAHMVRRADAGEETPLGAGDYWLNSSASR